MKKIGCVCDFKPLRNVELYKAFRQTVASSPVVDMDILYGLTAKQPASRFWTSERRAAEVVGMMIRGISISFMSPTRQRMFREIFRRFLDFRRRHPSASISEAAAMVVNSPAPEFYLTPKSVKVILCQYRLELRNARQEKGGRR